MRRVSLILTLILGGSIVACAVTQFPSTYHTLVYGARYAWNVYAIPNQPFNVIISNVALSGSDDTRLNYITRVSGNGQIVWDTPPMIAPENKPIVAVASDRVIVGFGTRLMALGMNDGRPIWETKLLGQVGFCESCITLVKDRLIVYSEGGIEGFDPTIGERIWSARIPRTYQQLRRTGEWIAVALPQTFNIYNPHDGDVVWQLPLQCDNASRPGMPRDVEPIMIGEPNDDRFFVRLGTCVQSWDLKTGQKRWEVAFDQERLGVIANVRGIARRNQSEMIKAGDYILVGTGETLRQRSPRNIVAIHADTGEARVLVSSEEHYLIPAGITAGGQVLVRSKDFLAVDPDQIWALNIDTGERVWAFQPDQPLDFDIVTTPDSKRVLLVEFNIRPRNKQVKPFLTRAVRTDVAVRYLDAETGVNIDLPALQLHIPEVTWIETVADSRFTAGFLNFGTIYAFNPEDLSLVYQWP